MNAMSNRKFQIQKFLNLSFYLIHFLPTKYWPLFPLFRLIKMTLDSSTELKIKNAPDEMVEFFFSKYQINNLIGDPESCLFVNENVFKSIGLKGYPFVKLKKKSHNKVFLVQLIPIPLDIENENILTTYTNFENLRRRLNIKENDGLIIEKILFSYETLFPMLASKAIISMLTVPFEIEAEIIDELLKNYFETPRYLYEDDIFCINVRQYYPEIFLKWNNHSLERLYFKVITLEGCESDHAKEFNIGYFVLKDRTTMFQTENGYGYFPQINEQFLAGKKNLKESVTSICPGGLEVIWNDLLRSLRLFFRPNPRPPLDPFLLVHGVSGTGKRRLLNAAALALGVNVMAVDGQQLQGVASGSSEGKLKFIFHRITRLAPCILYLRNIELIFKDKDGHEDSRVISAFLEHLNELSNEYIKNGNKFPIVIIATSESKNINTAIPAALARAFVYSLEIGVPDESQRIQMLKWIVHTQNIRINSESYLEKIASTTTGFTLRELESLVIQAFRIRYKKSRSSENNSIEIEMEDLDASLAGLLAAHANAIGAPRIPSVSWDDIGGLADLKKEIIRTVTFPLRHPELIKSGLRRSGLLLYGPPGTGKTLLAKAVATECTLNFLSVKGPELLNMYVGQSEENVREVFSRARSASPCIIFFDELDSLAPNRGRSGDSGGVMDRVVSQLLAELDGLQKATHVFVIGATNRPDLIDPALLRPGRFDKLLYVGVSEDKDGQLSVLKSLTRKFQLAPDVNLSELVNQLPENLTGADMYSVCANAWLNAARSVIAQIEAGSLSMDDATQVIVTCSDFENAITTASSSVSPSDLQYFTSLRKQFSSNK